VPIAWTEINGLATIFTSGGAVVVQGPEGGVAHVEGIVSLSHTKTPYTQYGDWFAMLCIIPTLVFLILSLLGNKTSKSDISLEKQSNELE
jgi:apolipoprotein N-acyltransferase